MLRDRESLGVGVLLRDLPRSVLRGGGEGERKGGVSSRTSSRAARRGGVILRSRLTGEGDRLLLGEGDRRRLGEGERLLTGGGERRRGDGDRRRDGGEGDRRRYP